MNILILSSLLTLNLLTVAAPVLRLSQKDRPTKLVRYQTGVYLMASGTKLRVNIDKQRGGQVYVQFIDSGDNLYLDRTLGPLEKEARLSLDLTGLTDGYYWLKISNGLEVEVREIKVTTPKQTVPKRSITIL